MTPDAPLEVDLGTLATLANAAAKRLDETGDHVDLSTYSCASGDGCTLAMSHAVGEGPSIEAFEADGLDSVLVLLTPGDAIQLASQLVASADRHDIGRVSYIKNVPGALLAAALDQCKRYAERIDMLSGDLADVEKRNARQAGIIGAKNVAIGGMAQRIDAQADTIARASDAAYALRVDRFRETLISIGYGAQGAHDLTLAALAGGRL